MSWRLDLLVADGATVGPAAGSGEAKTGIDPIEDDGVSFYFPSLFLHGFFHGVFGVPEEDLGGADEGDHLILSFWAIEEKGDFFPGFIGAAGFFWLANGFARGSPWA